MTQENKEKKNSFASLVKSKKLLYIGAGLIVLALVMYLLAQYSESFAISFAKSNWFYIGLWSLLICGIFLFVLSFFTNTLKEVRFGQKTFKTRRGYHVRWYELFRYVGIILIFIAALGFALSKDWIKVPGRTVEVRVEVPKVDLVWKNRYDSLLEVHNRTLPDEVDQVEKTEENDKVIDSLSKALAKAEDALKKRPVIYRYKSPKGNVAVRSTTTSMPRNYDFHKFYNSQRVTTERRVNKQ